MALGAAGAVLACLFGLRRDIAYIREVAQSADELMYAARVQAGWHHKTISRESVQVVMPWPSKGRGMHTGKPEWAASSR